MTGGTTSGRGDIIFIPRNTLHGAESVGVEELVIYWVLGGAGSLEDAGYVPAGALGGWSETPSRTVDR